MDSAGSASRELGMFLRARREQTRPEDLGLEPGPRRKVDGLRREEVAALAGLSTDYYQRLEQGRNARPSDAVLDSIADALELHDVDRDHIARLARAARRPTPRPRRPTERVPRSTALLLRSTELPAYVLSQHLDVLDWNAAAAELLGDPIDSEPEQRNVLMSLFRDDARLRFPDCEAMARDYIGMLRTAVARDPGHPRAIAIIGTLSARSAEFRRLWARHDVTDRVHGGKTIRHPRLGDIDIQWDAYPVPGTNNASMIVITARPGQEDRLQLLRSISTTSSSARTAADWREDNGIHTGGKTSASASRS